jgi:ribosomal protein L16 Arg81 hydroxylase
MTWSIGMRAPELTEFAAASDRLFPNRTIHVPGKDDSRVFYEDPDLDASEALPGLIAERSLRRARTCFDSTQQFNSDELSEIFGSMVTDPKAWLEPERLAKQAVRKIRRQLQEHTRLPVHGMARIAFTDAGEDTTSTAFVFANGFSRRYPRAAAPRIARLCAQRGLDRTDIACWQSDRDLEEILDWLLGCGVFEGETG